MRLMIALVFLLSFVLLPAIGVHPDGSGTADDPYLVASLDNLLWVSTTDSVWACHFTQTADIDATPTQTWNNGDGFVCIGVEICPFSGVYDGQNHTITGLWIDNDHDDLGMFRVEHGTVRNLTLQDAHIHSTDTNVGGIVGYANHATIVNCHVSGSIQGGNTAGGIAGLCVSSTVIDSCSSSAAVQCADCAGGICGALSDATVSHCTFSGGVSGELWISGICGYAEGAAISHCSNAGDVTGTSYIAGICGEIQHEVVVDGCSCDAAIQGDSYVGGLVGHNSNTTGNLIRNSTFTGQVNAVSFYGGLCGNSTRLQNSYYDIENTQINGGFYHSLGALPSSMYTQWQANGCTLSIDDYLTCQDSVYLIEDADDLAWLQLFGQRQDTSYRLTSDIDLSGTDDLFISYFTGMLQGDGHTIANFSLNDPAASHIGLIGAAYQAEICDVMLTNATVTGNICVGGLLGYTIAYVLVQRCSVEGSISGVEYVGGLAGAALSVRECRSAGTVTADRIMGGLLGMSSTLRNSYSIATVSGRRECGGLMGKSFYPGSVEKCYSAGPVISEGPHGGLNGYGNYTWPDCFWNTEIATNCTIFAGVGITTHEMQDLFTFLDAGWDFMMEDANGTDDVWCMNQDVNNGFPVLAWEGYAHNPPLFSLQPAGTGTSDDPWLIEDINNLYWLSTECTQLDGHFLQTDDIDASPSRHWLGYAGFAPIGSQQVPFTGTYNGQEYSIDSLYVCPETNLTGMFALAEGANLNDIHLTHATVCGTEYTGGLCGRAQDCTLVACSVQGEITGGNDTGALAGALANCDLIDCRAAGMVHGIMHVGGISGKAQQVNFLRCENEASVANTGECAGGIAGVCSLATNLYECRNTGEITCSMYTGGLIGLMEQGTLARSCNLGTVNGTWAAGGLAGLLCEPCSLADAYNHGHISGSLGGGAVGMNEGLCQNVYSSGVVTGTEMTGGLLGQNVGTVDACFWDVETSGQTGSAGGTGLATAALQMMSAYLIAGWDFLQEATNGTEDIWGLNENENGGYPFLSWEGYTHDPPQPSGGEADAPLCTRLQGNHPNPFNPSTTICFSIAQGERGELGIYNLRGQCVQRWRGLPWGRHELVWNGTNAGGKAVASGVYFCRLHTGSGTHTTKMLLLQ